MGQNNLAAITPITQRVIASPAYRNTESTLASWRVWFKANEDAVYEYWCELDDLPAGSEGHVTEFIAFAKSQYDIACSTAEADDESDVISSSSLVNAWQDIESDAAGVRAYGEI